jgi:predicted metal-binding protein
MAEAMSLVVCTTCRLARPEGGAAPDPDTPRDGARLSAALTAEGIAHHRQECLSACTRGCVVAFRGPARWTYVQGALDPDRDLADLITMIRAYAEAPDGLVPWRQRPEIIRKNTIARIPPLEV